MPATGTACYTLPRAEGLCSHPTEAPSFPFSPQGCSSREFSSMDTFEGYEGAEDMEKVSSALNVISFSRFFHLLPPSYSSSPPPSPSSGFSPIRTWRSQGAEVTSPQSGSDPASPACPHVAVSLAVRWCPVITGVPAWSPVAQVGGLGGLQPVSGSHHLARPGHSLQQ